jgi:hypothetical protein
MPRKYRRLAAIQIKSSNIVDEAQLELVKNLYDGQALGHFKKGLRKEFQSAGLWSFAPFDGR